MIDRLPWLTAAELAAAYRSGATGPVEATEAVLAWIERTEPVVHNFVTLLAERARAEAVAAERALAAGDERPLLGVPYSVKDLIAVADAPLRAGSRATEGWLPCTDATVVRKLTRAGAILLGKVATAEFAWGQTSGTSRNPWDGRSVSGGSSGGSGSAVAAGQGAFSIGTDCGCSLRAPAALNGVSALRPTHGRVSSGGCVPLSLTMDNVGPIARSAEDLGLVLDAIAGPDPDDPASLPDRPPAFGPEAEPSLRGWRIGVAQAPFFLDMEPGVEAVVREAIDTFASLGATLTPVDLPHADLAGPADVAIANSESAVLLGGLDEGTLGEDVRGQVSLGRRIPATEYVHAQQVRHLIGEDFAAVFGGGVDCILAPAVPATAKDMGDAAYLDIEYPSGLREDIGWAYCRFTFPMSLAGVPTVVVPCGLVDGLPTGIQIVAARRHEARAIAAGHAFQRVTDFHRARPSALATRQELPR